MTKQEYFYNDKQLKTLSTTKDFKNTNKKYYWDGNNGDKWEIIERFGYPITFISVKCLDQNKAGIFKVNDLKDNNYFPTNS